MKTPKSVNDNRLFGKNNFILMLISLTALLTTFLVSNLNLDFSVKLSIFIAEISLYLLCCALFYSFYSTQKRSNTVETESFDSTVIFTSDIDEKLFALEETHRFFGASLKSADMFRLAASRLNEIIPFAACVYLTADEKSLCLKSLFADGKNSQAFIGLELKADQGLAGKTFQIEKAQLSEQLSEDKTCLPVETLTNLNTGIAVPLKRGAKVFGVLVLYGDRENQFNRSSLKLLEAAAARIVPLVLSSQAFEANLNGALTDSLTNLPNERAFYLILENQIAETQRSQEKRPLTVLGIDIKDFNEINQKYGHSTGDRILRCAAETIKNQLRQMDFLARSTSDEFLVVLPTASEEITREIIERVEKALILNPFETSSLEVVPVDLYFGAASFGKDGETAAALVKHARLKKQQAKSEATKSNVLWFSKGSVN